MKEKATGLTVSQIAEASGVSKATVSRVLNGRPGVQTNNVRAVLDAIRDLNGEAQPTPEGRRRIQTVAYLRMDDRMAADQATTGVMVFEGASAALSDRGIDMICGSGISIDRLPAAVTDGKVSGLLLAGLTPDPVVLEHLANLPQVWLSSYRTDNGVHVLPGNEQVAAWALEYLRQRGHRSVGYINPCSSHPALAARGAFFDMYAKQRGLTVSGWTADQPFSAGSAPTYWNRLEATLSDLLDKALATDPAPTGLFLPLASMVRMAYRVMQVRGLTPGRDFDCVTCGGEEEIMSLYPRPGVIDISPQEMGRRAVVALLERITHPDADRHGATLVDPKLVTGEPVLDNAVWAGPHET